MARRGLPKKTIAPMKIEIMAPRRDSDENSNAAKFSPLIKLLWP
jgi:hypothetical protein